MKITQIHALYWSAAGHTRRIVHHIGQFLSQSFMVPVIDTDLTSFNKRQNNFEIPSTSFVVFGMPTYAGKLPNKIMPFIREHVHGNQTNVLAIVTFGNRNFDHALAELCFLLSENHFCIKGAAALVCEHAFSQKIATGHPDTKDFKQIDVFLGQVLKNIQSHKTLSTPIPGDPNAPYYIPKGIDGKPVNFLKAKPVTDTNSVINVVFAQFPVLCSPSIYKILRKYPASASSASIVYRSVQNMPNILMIRTFYHMCKCWKQIIRS